MSIRTRRWSPGLALAVAATALLLPAPGRAAAPATAAEQLAAKYAPITMIREQQHPPCETTTEQYEPTSVDTVLGNPLVTLDRQAPGQRRPVPVRRAPTARDIAGLGSEYYLNLRGSPLGDTCRYARDFAAIKRRGGAPIVTYAHIAREDGHPGFALQYWFFWYFNQFNDLHEGDWEGMQLTFDEATPQAALASEPDQLIVFQHAGGERAGWDDAKVEKEGDHPVVYPAAGSHATFYNSAVYVENGEHGSGLGCDDTSGPSRELHPRPILLPDAPTNVGPFAWLSYDGRWGQKEAGFNNGPTGPQTKKQWARPFSWMSAQRNSSARLPGGSVLGPQVSKAFCGAVSTVAGILNAKEKSSASTIVGLLLFAFALVAFVGFTRWRPVDLSELRARRSFGQLVRTARQLYGRHWIPMVLIALTAIPIIGGTQQLVAMLGDGSPGVQAVGDLFDTLARPVATAIVSGVVIVYVRSLVETGEAGFLAAWRGMLRMFWRVVLAQLLATVGVILMFVTVVGIPFGVWKLVSWAFVQQEVLFSDHPIRRAFRGSSDAVRGRWWHTVRAVIFFNLLEVVAGPLLTFALIFTSLPLWLINLLGSLIFALLIPYSALGQTLLYFDLEARAATEPGKPYRSWRPWRPRQFGRVVRRPEPAPGT